MSNDSCTGNCKIFGRKRVWFNQGTFPEFFSTSDKGHENNFRITDIQAEISNRHL